MSSDRADRGRDAPALRALFLAVAIPLGLACVFGLLVLEVSDRVERMAMALVGGAYMTTAYVALSVEVVLCYLTWQLLAGQLEWVGDLQIVAVEGATLTFIALVLGDWRAASLAPSTLDPVSRPFVEANHLSTLFALPTSVVVAFLVRRYGVALRRERELRDIVAFTLSVAAVFTIVLALSARS